MVQHGFYTVMYLSSVSDNKCSIKHTIQASHGPGARFSKNLRKNPKFSVSYSKVYVKFIESYKVKIFTEF